MSNSVFAAVRDISPVTVGKVLHRVVVLAFALLVVVPQVVAEHAVAFELSETTVVRVAAAAAAALTIGRVVIPADD